MIVSLSSIAGNKDDPTAANSSFISSSMSRASGKTQWSGYEFYRKQVWPKRDFDSARSLSFPFPSSGRSNGEAGKQAKHENNSDSGKSQKQKDGRTDGRTDEKAEGRNRCAVEFCGTSFGSAPHAATNGSRLRIKKGRGSANLFLERSCVRDVHTIQSRLQSLR